MANPIVTINRRAKALQRAHKTWTWKFCIQKASAEYRSKHHGKKKPAKRRRVGSIGKGKPGKAARAPEKVFYVKRGPTPRRGIGGVSTRSKSHVDKNRFTANIQIGGVPASSLHAELKRRIKEKIDRAVVRRYHAGTKRDKKRLSKEITQAKTQLRKLS